MIYNICMAYASLYRKYRPSTFDEVIGQDAVVRTLRNMVAGAGIAHAYLFTGTRGTGKTSVARIFARAVNCAHPVGGSPCGTCEACRSFASGANMDVVEMDAASNNSVEDIRALRESVKYPPADPNLRYKVYIIDEVHQLSTQAFNAFLKTLEEPPEYCIFILATTEVHKLPQTILSRCLRFDFRMVAQSALAEHVGHIFDLEHVQYDNDALWAIAAAGNGSVRDTLSVADTCMSAAAGNVTYDIVLQVLGANDPNVIADIAEAVLKGQLAAALARVEQSVALGKSVPVLTKDIAKYIRDLLIVKADQKANDYLRLPEAMFNRAKGIAESIDSAVLVRALDVFSGLDGNMRLASSPRTVLENAIAHTATFSGQNMADVVARIAAVEREVGAVESRIKDGVVVPKGQVQVAPVAVAQSETVQAKEQSEPELDLPAATDALTAVEDPFGTQQEEKTEAIRTSPNDYMSAGAAAVKYKGMLIAKLRERKLLFIYTIIDSAFVEITGDTILFKVAGNADEKYCEGSRAVLEELTTEILGKAYKLVFKYIPPKVGDEDGISRLMQIVGANKITTK